MIPITIQEFKTQFPRDFTYGEEEGKVSNADISRAMVEASVNFNDALFDEIVVKKMMFCYLTAYFLVVDINNATSQGGAANSGLVTYRQVRNVAESFAIPKWISENPLFSMYAQNGYGLKYITMIQPYLVGAVGIAFGRTLP